MFLMVLQSFWKKEQTIFIKKIGNIKFFPKIFSQKCQLTS